jgi:hypothetical protein
MTSIFTDVYQIVNPGAPERRVFAIDVGGMQPQQARAYLESIKNDMCQKRVSNDMGAPEHVTLVANTSISKEA